MRRRNKAFASCITHSRGTNGVTQTLRLSYLKKLPYMFYNTALNIKTARESSKIGWISRTESDNVPIDKSAEFDSIISNIQRQSYSSGYDKLPAAEVYHYIFVGGLWSQYVPLYFRTSTLRLRALGLTSEQAKIDTSASVAANALALKRIFYETANKIRKSLVVIASSKGGVDTISSLLLYPELQRDRVIHGCITLQSPLGGTVIADDYLASSSCIRKALDWLVIQHVARDFGCVRDLTYEARLNFVKEHPLSNLSQVKVLNFASHLDSGNYAHFQGLYEYAKTNYDIDTDGLVAVKDCILPGHPYVNASGITHMGTGSPLGYDGGSRLKAADIIHALVTMLHLPDIWKHNTSV